MFQSGPSKLLSLARDQLGLLLNFVVVVVVNLIVFVMFCRWLDEQKKLAGVSPESPV